MLVRGSILRVGKFSEPAGTATSFGTAGPAATPEPAAPGPAGTAISFGTAGPAATPEQPETAFAMEEQLRTLEGEMATLQRRLKASQMVHSRILEQAQARSKGKGPALPDHPEPECTPEHRGPSSSNARAPSEHGTWVNSSDSDGHSDNERRFASLADEYGRIDGIPTADWVAQQQRAFRTVRDTPRGARRGDPSKPAGEVGESPTR